MEIDNPPPPSLIPSEGAEEGRFYFWAILIHTALLFQKVGLIVPDGNSDALHLKQRHIQVGLFPIQSSHSAQTVCVDKLPIAPKNGLPWHHIKSARAMYEWGNSCILNQVDLRRQNERERLCCGLSEEEGGWKKVVTFDQMLLNQASISLQVSVSSYYTLAGFALEAGTEEASGSLRWSRTLWLDYKLLTLLEDTLCLWYE